MKLLVFKSIPENQKTIIHDILQNKIDFAIKYIDAAVKVYHSENFYIPKLFSKAIKVLSVAFDCISAVFYPNNISFKTDYKNLSKLTLEQIGSESESLEKNIFYRFYLKKLNEYISEDSDFIGVSIPNKQNIIPAFTLTKMLKKNHKAKICVGESSISQCRDIVLTTKDFFNSYFDYALLGDGEEAIVNLLEYIQGKTQVENVSGLITLNENSDIISVPINYINSFKNIALPIFKGLKFDKLIIPIFASKGCYWGKCTFCDLSYGTKHFGEIKINSLIKYDC